MVLLYSAVIHVCVCVYTQTHVCIHLLSLLTTPTQNNKKRKLQEAKNQTAKGIYDVGEIAMAQQGRGWALAKVQANNGDGTYKVKLLTSGVVLLSHGHGKMKKRYLTEREKLQLPS